MLKFKLIAVFVFATFAVGAFLTSGPRTLAGGDDKKKADEVLAKVANYKSWNQVVKPEVKKDAPSDVLGFTNFAAGG